MIKSKLSNSMAGFNVPGPYYNDLSCIDCGMCPEIAPLIFKRQEDAGYSYVYRQPVTPEEIALAEEAKESCPTESIGNDGASSELLPIPIGLVTHSK